MTLAFCARCGAVLPVGTRLMSAGYGLCPDTAGCAERVAWQEKRMSRALATSPSPKALKHPELGASTRCAQRVRGTSVPDDL